MRRGSAPQLQAVQAHVVGNDLVGDATRDPRLRQRRAVAVAVPVPVVQNPVEHAPSTGYSPRRRDAARERSPPRQDYDRDRDEQLVYDGYIAEQDDDDDDDRRRGYDYEHDRRDRDRDRYGWDAKEGRSRR